jgi:hypothetical protein
MMIVVFGGILASAASAQVEISPVQFYIRARPGDLVASSFTVWNVGSDQVIGMKVRLVDLVQAEDGRLIPVEALDQALGAAGLRSCAGWIGLQAQGIEVGPGQDRVVAMEIKVPPGAADLYWAGVELSTNSEGQSGAILREFRYLIPVLVQVGSQRPSSDVQIEDTGLAIGPAGQAQVYMVLRNAGLGYSQVNGTARIIALSGDRQQVVMPRLVFDRVGILPGSRLVVRQDLDQPLAKGTYKVSIWISIDRRTGARRERSVAFGQGPQLDLYLNQFGQAVATIVLGPSDAIDPKAEPRLFFEDDGRPMRLLLDQASREPLFVGSKTITVRSNCRLDVTAEASGMSAAGGIWVPNLSQAFGQPDRVQLQLTGRRIEVSRLASSTERVVRLAVTCAPRL